MAESAPRGVRIGNTLVALFVGIGWSTCQSVAAADTPVSLSGSVRADYFGSTRTLDDRRDLLGATLQVKGIARPSDNTSIKVEARATSPAIGRSSPKSDASLVEGYASLNAGRWDWRLGHQIVAWGRADGINPTDVVSPRNTTVLLPFDVDQRRGIWGAMGTYALSSETSLSLLWKTDFEPTGIAIPADERSNYQFQEPDHQQAQWGMRLNRAGDDVDWSVSLFRGHSLLPNAGPDQPAPGMPLRLTYPLITMLGADLAKNFGAFGTRFEAAYTVPVNTPRAQEPGLRRNLYVVAGVDRTFFPRLNVNVQAFVRHAWGLPNALDGQYTTAQGFNAATFMQQRPWVHGLTLRVSNAWLHDTLEAEVFVQRFFRDDDTFVQPMVTYAFSDAVRGTVGAQYYAGSGAQFGPMKRNRGLFAELRYSF